MNKPDRVYVCEYCRHRLYLAPHTGTCPQALTTLKCPKCGGTNLTYKRMGNYDKEFSEPIPTASKI